MSRKPLPCLQPLPRSAENSPFHVIARVASGVAAGKEFPDRRPASGFPGNFWVYLYNFWGPPARSA